MGGLGAVITLPHTFRICSPRRFHRLNMINLIEYAYASDVDLWRSEFSSDVVSTKRRAGGRDPKLYVTFGLLAWCAAQRQQHNVANRLGCSADVRCQMSWARILIWAAGWARQTELVARFSARWELLDSTPCA